jgi:hypothetical protein
MFTPFITDNRLTPSSCASTLLLSELQGKECPAWYKHCSWMETTEELLV